MTAPVPSVPSGGSTLGPTPTLGADDDRDGDRDRYVNKSGKLGGDGTSKSRLLSSPELRYWRAQDAYDAAH